jgi:hypothetical protein
MLYAAAGPTKAAALRPISDISENKLGEMNYQVPQLFVLFLECISLVQRVRLVAITTIVDGNFAWARATHHGKLPLRRPTSYA